MAYNDIILADSPVGYWRLNESSGVVAVDSGSGLNNGTYENAPVLDQNGLIFENTGRSVDFEEASNQFVSFTANPLTDLLNGSAKITVEVWVKIESFTTRNIFISSIIDIATPGISLRTDTNGDITIFAKSVTGDAFQILSVPWNITGAISHIVGIVDFTNKALYLFQDGAQIGKLSAIFANTTYTKGTPSTNDSLAGLPGLTQLMDGRSAEVALYNKALTPLQIRQHYNAGIAKGFDKEVLSLVPTVYLPLDEISGDSKDRVEQNNGVHTNTVQNVEGGLVSFLSKDDKSVNFNSVSSTISVADAPTIQNIFSSGGTAGVWINPVSDGGGARILDKSGNFTNGWLIQIREEAGGFAKIRFIRRGSVSDGEWTTNNLDIILNQWSFVVINFDDGIDLTVNDPLIYINGLLVAITETSVPSGTGVSDITSNLIIGSTQAVAFVFDGDVQKPFLVGSILSVGVIRTLYQSGIVDLIDRGYDKVISNLVPVGYWRLGEGRNTTVFDDSVNVRDGVITGDIVVGQIAVVANDPQTGMLFDGIGDFIEAGAVADYSFIQNTGVFTIFALVAIRDHTLDDGYNIFGNNSGTVSEKGFNFFYDNRVSSGSPKRYRLEFTDGTVTVGEVDFDNAISDNNTHSIVVTGDGTNARLYIDGVLVSTSAAFGALSTGDSSQILAIGRANTLTSFDMDGTMSRVGILSTQATTQQVLQMHEAFLSRFAAEAISKQPVFYSRLNETSGNAINYGADGSVGIVTGATQGDIDTPLSNEIPATTSYNFDGLSGDVDFGSSAALDDIFDGGGTALAFIKASTSGENSLGRLFDKRANTTNGWTIFLVGAPGLESIRLLYEFDTTNGTWGAPSGTLSVDVFQMVAATYNADSAANVPNLYFDSLESIPNFADIQAVGTRASEAAENLLIGNRTADDGTFDGEIAEAMLFSSILSGSDILDIQEAASLLFTPFFGFTGDLTENFTLEDWLIRAHRLDNGVFLAEAIVDIPTKSYSLDIQSTGFQGACALTMLPKVFKLWLPNDTVSLGDYIIPTDPTNPSNFFKVTVPGTTGPTEPTWVLSGDTIDNTVTWQDQGSLIRPKVQSPRLPSL